MTEKQFKDKITGCWMGKNSGGTLGAPLEKAFGQREMFDIDWYPTLKEGGIPNDDLEMQLIWLQKLQQKGPALTEKDLIQAWMDSIQYNFDEYGLAKANMKKGLMPPVCSWYDNPFKDCMGSPIRSEIWACVAPGHPEIAAHYAFLDAICDHGGGESVYGEVFNAVIQSMAFFVSNLLQLIEIGLKAIPAESATARCIKRVVELHKKEPDYKKTRNIILDEFYDANAQYSPLNLGFQTIGLLYGNDFGDAMCKAVNCGYDTDCTAATIGAILGIIMGFDKLPTCWIEPLGKNITTNLHTGGISNLEVPTEVDKLTDITYEQAEKVLSYWGKTTLNLITKEEALQNCENLNSKWLESYMSNAITYSFGGIVQNVVYHEDAAIIGNRKSKISLILHNTNFANVDLTVVLQLPKGFDCPITFSSLELKADEKSEIFWEIEADPQFIEQSNKAIIQISCKNRPAIPAIPLVLCGGRKFFVSPLFEGKKLDDSTSIAEDCIFLSKPKDFTTYWTTDNDLKLDYSKAGVVYFIHDIHSKIAQDVYIGLPTNNRGSIYLNGKHLNSTTEIVPLRPNLGGGGDGDGSNYAKGHFDKGWNQVLLKLEIAGKNTQAHFTLGSSDPVYALKNCSLVEQINETRSRFSIN